MSAPPTKIFVGRLPVDAKADDLRNLFEKYGVVTECDVLNRFGFVHMKTEDMAKKAIDSLHNSEFMGTKITVEPSTGKKGSGGGGGGRPGGGRMGGGSRSGGGRPGGGGRMGGGRPTPYDRPMRDDRYTSPRNGGGYYDDYDYYPRRSSGSSYPPSRDHYGPPPPYERRAPYDPYDRYPSDRDRRPPPPMSSSYDRRMMDYPPPRSAPDYRRRSPPPSSLSDSYGSRYDRDMYDAPPVDHYSSKRYGGAAPLDRDLPPRRY